MSSEPEQGRDHSRPIVSIHYKGVTATIYDVDGFDTYFCCNTCGACGQHWHSEDYTITQALHHIMHYDHTQYLEDHHGSDRP